MSSHVPLPVLMCQPGDAAMGTNLAGNQEHMASFTNQNKAEPPPSHHTDSLHT